MIPGGGLGSLARIELIRLANVSTLLCTPTYALRLAEVAADNHINLAALSVDKIIVAGEPGGSVVAMRQRIESAWGTAASSIMVARPRLDLGDLPTPMAAACTSMKPTSLPSSVPSRRAIRHNEGELAHLILTTLGRSGTPPSATGPATWCGRCGQWMVPIASFFSTAAYWAAPTT